MRKKAEWIVLIGFILAFIYGAIYTHDFYKRCDGAVVRAAYGWACVPKAEMKP